MTLIISWLLIAGFEFHWIAYLVTLAVWCVHVSWYHDDE
jgi:hypothetical protein